MHVTILENTLRDGSYVFDFQMTKKHTVDICRGLETLGFSHIEVGHGLGLGASRHAKITTAKESDVNYISSAREAAPNAQLSSFFIPGIGTKEDIKTAADLGLDILRVGININNYQETREYAEYARSLGLTVCINLMKSYAVKSYEFARIVQQIDRWQLAKVIYLVDSAGCMMPDEVREFLDKSRLGITTEMGFHGHNNLSFAAANSIEAVKAGATWVDSCVRGMGRSAGNAQTEILVYLLQKMGIASVAHFDIYELYDFAKEYIVPIMPRVQGFTDEEIHIGISKFHSSFMPFVSAAVEKYPIDKRRLIKDTSAINCLDPSEHLFMEVAEMIYNND